MKLLFCCEFYFPSVGGVQEVMRQIAERMVAMGHDVTVATTRLADRSFSEHNGVKIVEFGVMGNHVRGISGEVSAYQDFVRNFPCDAILIKAAQQWTFDALWPILDQIKARKVFIPCGFSGLYEPGYKQYFIDIRQVLPKFDHLIFYAEKYRDTDFAKACGLKNLTILANGASETEFAAPLDPTFRQRHDIPPDSFVLLTVGSFTGVKGHREVVEAFVRMKPGNRHVTLILNGNEPPRPVVVKGDQDRDGADNGVLKPPGYIDRLLVVWRREGYQGLVYRLGTLHSRIQQFAFHSLNRVQKYLERYKLGWIVPPRLRLARGSLGFWVAKANKDPVRKKLLVVDLPRSELVQAYKAADLFVFASNIEYSPLVLFEALAGGTPFLSVPVGNAEEIAEWTGGGRICPAEKDQRGYTRVAPERLAREILKLMQEPGTLEELARVGHASWQEKYTWNVLARRYEDILKNRQETES